MKTGHDRYAECRLIPEEDDEDDIADQEDLAVHPFLKHLTTREMLRRLAYAFSDLKHPQLRDVKAACLSMSADQFKALREEGGALKGYASHELFPALGHAFPELTPEQVATLMGVSRSKFFYRLDLHEQYFRLVLGFPDASKAELMRIQEVFETGQYEAIAQLFANYPPHKLYARLQLVFPEWEPTEVFWLIRRHIERGYSGARS